MYCNDPKFLDIVMGKQCRSSQIRQLLEEEQSDQGLHCLHFSVHLLDVLLCNRMPLSEV